MANDERDADLARLVDQFDEGMGGHLLGLKERVGDEHLLADAAAIIATATSLVGGLRQLRPDDLVLDDVLDRSLEGWQGAGRSVTAHQFVEELSAAQVVAEQKANAVSEAVRQHDRRREREGARQAAEQHELERQQLAARKQTLEELRRQRDALDAQGPGADSAERILLEGKRELLDVQIHYGEERVRINEAALELGAPLVGFHTAGEMLADLFHEGYQQITADYAKTRRATARRRQRSRWLRRLRYLVYVVSGLVVGQVVTPATPLWGFVVALGLWGVDQVLVQPRLARWEASKRSVELQTEVYITALVWLRLRSLQTVLQFTARSSQVTWEPFVPMTPFAAGRAALGIATDPDASP